MSAEVQGAFASEKIAKVRWLPAEYGESRQFVSGSWDNAENFVRLWRTNDEEPETYDDDDDEEEPGPRVVRSKRVDGDVCALLHLNAVNEPTLAVATSRGEARLLSLPDLEVARTWPDLHAFSDGTPSACTAMAALDGDMATVGEDGRMNFLTYLRAQVVRRIDDADSCSMHCVCFLKHNEVITGNMRGQMKIWDLRSQSSAPSRLFLLNGDAATSIVHHPTQRHLVLAGGESGALSVWDLRVESYPASLLNAHSAAVTEIQFHPDHPQQLFTCSASGELWHWNTASMAKHITTTNMSAMNESTINPWLMDEGDKSSLEVSSLMADLHKSINSLDCNKSRLVCGCDNEAVYLLNNIYN